MTTKQTFEIKRFLSLKGAYQGIPITGAFELTPRCNLACKMCYVRLTPQEMAERGRERTKDEWLEIGRQAKKAGTVFLLLTGGEPMLRPDFEEIYRGLSEMGFSIFINTNGSYMNDSIKELFRELPPAMVNVTLYGASAEGYERLCGRGDVYNKVTETILWLKEQDLSVTVNCTVTPWNVDELEQIYHFVKKENLYLRLAVYNFPPARREGAVDYARLQPEQAGKILAEDLLRRKGLEHIRYLTGHLEEDGIQCSECGMEPGITCFAGRSQFWITWDGRMLPCGMLTEPKENLWEKGFSDSWESIKEQVAKIRLCSDCRECREKGTCSSCAAVLQAETKDFTKKPEYMCEVNRAYRKSLRELGGKAHEKE